MFQFGSDDSTPEYLRNVSAMHVEVSNINSFTLGIKLRFIDGPPRGTNQRVSE